MTSNVALDVFIGLVFVYLLYSLLASIIQETIASFLNLRAVVLVKAIRIMLNDRKPLDLHSTSTFGKFIERIFNTFKTQLQYIACRLPDLSLAKAFYKHPSIKYLSPNSSRSKPSYIEPNNFSATLIQILRGKNFDGSVPSMLAIYNTLYPMITAAGQNTDVTTVEVGKTDPVKAIIQPETLDKLRQLYVDSGKDINVFTTSLENWYNEIMDRANGWYKRQVRRILFFLGLIIAIWGNVDTIKIYHVLSKDKAARNQLVQMAIQSEQKYAPVVNQLRDTNHVNSINNSDTQKTIIITTGDSLLDQTYNDVKNDIDESNYVLAMGWHTSAKYKLYDSLLTVRDTLKNRLARGSNDTSSLQSQLKTTNDHLSGYYSLIKEQSKWQDSLTNHSTDTTIRTRLQVISSQLANYANLSAKQNKLKDSLQKLSGGMSLQNRLQVINAQIEDLKPLVYDKFDWSSSPLGWLITAMALTLGAPFWFDLLSKFISLRAAGKRPDTDIIKDDKAITPAILPPETIAASVKQNGIVITDDQPLIVPDEAGDSTLAQG